MGCCSSSTSSGGKLGAYTSDDVNAGNRNPKQNTEKQKLPWSFNERGKLKVVIKEANGKETIRYFSPPIKGESQSPTKPQGDQNNDTQNGYGQNKEEQDKSGVTKMAISNLGVDPEGYYVKLVSSEDDAGTFETEKNTGDTSYPYLLKCTSIPDTGGSASDTLTLYMRCKKADGDIILCDIASTPEDKPQCWFAADAAEEDDYVYVKCKNTGDYWKLGREGFIYGNGTTSNRLAVTFV